MTTRGGGRPGYGLDAPMAVRNVVLAAMAGLVVGAMAPDAEWGWWVGGILLVEACYMVWGSLVGKPGQRDRLLARVAWRGTEQVLDVGCGRGLLVVGAAHRLTRGGRAVGVDDWRATALTGNSADAVLRNAAHEGVAGRVSVERADARALPFPDRAFDVVLSSLALHAIADDEGRGQALAEMVRVLRPGGLLLVQDNRHSDEYMTALRRSGLADVVRGPLQFRLFPPVRIVSGRRPSSGGGA